MRCSNCGFENPKGLQYCGSCGHKIGAADVSTPVSGQRSCVSCGRNINWDVNVCPYCGHDYRTRTVGPPTVPRGSRNCVSCGRSIEWDYNVCPFCGHDFNAQPQAEKKGNAVAGGILTVVAGAIGLLVWVLYAESTGYESVFPALLLLAFTFVAIIGGVFAIVRKGYPVAVIGGVCAVVTAGFFLGIPGLILIAMSRKDFK